MTTINEPRKWSLTLGYCGAFVVFGAIVSALGPTLPGLAANTGTTLGAISFLFTARSLGYLAGALVSGRLYDRLPGNPVVVAMLLVMAVVLGVAPLIPSLVLLTAVMLALGVAEGAVEVGGNTLLLWVHRRNAAPFVNALHFCFGGGAFLAPIVVAGALRLAGDSTRSYWAFALLALPVAAWLARLGSPARQAADGTGPAERTDNRLVALIALFFVLYAGVEHSFGGWIYSYATALNLSRASTAALLSSAFWGAITAGRLLAIPIAVRVSGRAILAGCLAGCLASLALFVFFPGSAGAMWVGTVGLGLALGPIVPTMLAFAGERMAVSGRATAWFFVGLGSGAMTVPLLIGQFFEDASARAMIAVLLVDLLLAAGLLAWLTRYAGRQTGKGAEWAA